MIKKQQNIKKKKNFFKILINQIFYNKPNNQEELLSLIQQSEKKSLINEKTYNMLKGVIKITKKRIKEIMTPKSQMIILKENYSFHKCLDIIIDSGFSRFPVMNDDNNHVKGYLLSKDLLKFIKKKNQLFYIKHFLRNPIVVPEIKYVDNMLTEFLKKQYHMAIVIDEFGTVSGLITIEDILEIIVGKIFDECDNKNTNYIQQIKKDMFSINALTQIKEFNKIFNTKFNDKRVDTIGGFIMQKFKYLPNIGETIKIDNYKFIISMSNSRKIIKINMIIPKNKIIT